MPKGAGNNRAARFAGLLATIAAAGMRRAARGRPRIYGPGNAAGKRTFLAKRRGLRTKTATTLAYSKNKPNNINKVYNRGAGVPSEDRLVLYSPPSSRVRAMKKVGAPDMWETNFATSMTADEGQQTPSYVSWSKLDDLKFIMTKVPNSASGAGYNGTGRYVLQKMTGEIVYQNSSLATAFLEIYDIVRKTDAVSDSSADPTQSPVVAWSQGSYDAAAGVGSPALNVDFLKASPFDSLLFKNQFKIIKRTRVSLTQGSVHRHAVVASPNQLIDNSRLAYAQGDIRGVSHYTMAVVYGQPASIPSDGGPIVTTASVQIDYVQTLRYKYTFVVDNTQTLIQTDNLSTLTGEQVVSIGGGVIVPNARV